MKYKFKTGGNIKKLQKAGLIPKMRSLFKQLTKQSKSGIKALDKSLEGKPTVIHYTPQVRSTGPYARISRDLSTINETQSFSIDDDPFNTFQLVKDLEPKQYSVHFKTTGRHALTEPQKQQLFSAVADAIPGGSILSTHGEVSKGGLAGLKRFEGLGFKPTLQTRRLGLKMAPTAEDVFPFGELVGKEIEVPLLYKPKEVVVGSRPISIEEKLGTPKGERNNKVIIDKDLHKSFLDGRDQINTRTDRFPYTLEEIEKMNPVSQENAMNGRSKFVKQMNQYNINWLGDDEKINTFNSLLKDYIKPLGEDVDPRFESIFNEEGFERPSLAVRAFRNYLIRNGVDASQISNHDLARFLTDQYRKLSSEATGKLKDDVLWHGSKTWFDSFDLTHTSENTGNSGALGPGNYFSLTGGSYGRTNNFINYLQQLNNTQPYIITGITSTPNGYKMIEKGILPNYMGKDVLRSEIGKLKLKQLIESIPTNDNRAYIDTKEAAASLFGEYEGPNAAVMIRRNTGIKSLFPHPSRFVRNPDGSVSLIPTDWSDIRVNYKQGGIINRFKNKLKH